MGCSASLLTDEERISVVVFGASGMVGGAVARALVKNPRFAVKAISRKPGSDALRSLAEGGAVIATADLDDTKSLEVAVHGVDVMFLVTHYWEHMDQSKETQQGKNAVNVAVKCNIKHLVFCGAESVLPITGKECGHMDAKAAIEEHMKETGITYTIIRLPFFYENLLGVFRPHNTGDEMYALALPTEGVAIDCMSVHDMSRCVVNLLLRPRDFLFRTVGLTVERITAEHMAVTIQKHFSNKQITASNIRVSDFESFEFKGSQEIAAMFEFYQTGELERDVKITKKLYGSSLSFERWVAENRDKIDNVLSNRRFSQMDEIH
ncbi:nmrA-like family domain-containing protein 1 [Gigantopelta aegis]|uniref:nmrA-like family domain-containing protein 1 n=1 Tax=Gigantopelta aegis TaxID=1735272 RepID=UPI001B887EEC|nr:nmrA-like family domain-containing protein 1 [Gigantopelta aegis]